LADQKSHKKKKKKKKINIQKIKIENILKNFYKKIFVIENKKKKKKKKKKRKLIFEILNVNML